MLTPLVSESFCDPSLYKVSLTEHPNFRDFVAQFLWSSLFGLMGHGEDKNLDFYSDWARTSTITTPVPAITLNLTGFFP